MNSDTLMAEIVTLGYGERLVERTPVTEADR